MGDVTRFITNLHSEKLQGSPGSAVSADTLTRALDVLESGMRSDDEEVQELISVSFLENLEQDDPNHLNLKSLLGSSLLEELKKYEW